VLDHSLELDHALELDHSLDSFEDDIWAGVVLRSQILNSSQAGLPPEHRYVHRALGNLRRWIATMMKLIRHFSKTTRGRRMFAAIGRSSAGRRLLYGAEPLRRVFATLRRHGTL